MARRIWQLLGLTGGVLTVAVLFYAHIPIAHALVRPVVVSKTIRNTSLSVSKGNALATVTKAGDIVQVTLVITNKESAIPSITVRDVLGEPGRTLSKPGTIQLLNGTVGPSGACQGNVIANPINTAPAGSPFITYTLVNLNAASQYCVQYNSTVAAALFPNFKSRLVGYPVFVTDSGSTTEALYDVGYLYFDPPISAVTGGVTTSLFNSSPTDFDIGAIISGATVTVTSGGASPNETITTPGSFLVQPNQGQLASANVGDNSCQVQVSFLPLQRGRGNACIFSTTASITDSVTSDQLGSAMAHFMVLPSSSIIGSVYTNGASGLDAGHLLLPGSHVVAGATTPVNSSSANNVTFSIDPNSVAGWDTTAAGPAQVYKNVYQNANVSRLLRNPNRTFTNACTTSGVLSPALTCVVVGGVATYTLHINNTLDFNLGASDLLGTAGAATSVPPSKDGYVVYFDGNLIVPNATGALETLNNEVGGTIIVSGSLTLNNIRINPGSGPLGFIVGTGAAGARNVVWNVQNNLNSSMQSVAFFVPNGTFSVTKPGTGAASLIGSIVANNVDLSGIAPAVGTAGQLADLSGITITYDQALSQSPPPGFNLFSSSPVLIDQAP